MNRARALVSHLLMVGSVLPLAVPALAQAPNEAAAPAPALTEPQFLKDYHSFFRSVALGVFDEMHPQPTPEDTAARPYIESFAADQARQWALAMATRDAVDGSHELVKKKYTDPVFLVAVAYYLNDSGDTALVPQRIQAMPDTLPKTPQGDFIRFLASEQLSASYKARENPKRQEEAARAGLAPLLSSVKGGLFKDRSRMLVEALYDTVEQQQWPEPVLAELCNQLDAIETLDPWVKHTIRGQVEMKTAWNRRGGRFARKVTDEGWKGFEEHLEMAREHLTKAYELNPDRPEPSIYMITVAMGGAAAPGENERTWFDRARKAQAGSVRALNAMRWALRPRWNGSYEEMYEFGMECAASRRFDTLEPFSFILTLKELGDETENIQAVMKLPGAAENAKRILNTYLENPAADSIVDDDRAKADLMVINWALGDFAEARRLRDDYGENLTGNEIGAWGINLSPAAFSDEIFLSSSPVAALARKGDKQMEDGEYIEANLSFTRAIAELAGADPDADIALRRRLELARITAAIGSDEPVTFNFLKGLPGWGATAAAWFPKDSGDIDLRANDETSLCRLKMDVGDRYQISARVQLAEKSSAFFSAGIVVGLVDTRSKSRWHYAVIRGGFRDNRNLMVGARELNQQGQIFDARLDPKPSYVLTVKVWDEQVFVYVDDKFYFGGHVEINDDEYVFGPRFGLGSSHQTASGNARFSEVKLSPLSQPPAEFDQAKVLRPTPKPPARKVTPRPKNAPAGEKK